jgi:hypothetical protein
MALNFNLLNTETPGQIATSVMRGYEGAQKLAQEKETNALNLKIKKEELDTFRQDRQKLLEFRDQMAKVGKNGTVRQISDTFLGSGIPEQMKLGIELRKEVEKHDRLAKALGEPTSDELFATAPSAPVAPAMPGTLGSGTFGMAPEPMATPANALMPTAAPSAPANALMPTPAPAKRVLTTEDKINNLIRGGFTEEARILQAQQTALNREDKLSGDAAVMQQLGYPLTREGYAAFKAISRAPASVVNVTNVQEKEERKARGKLLVDQYSEVSQAAKLANKTLPALETQESVLSKGFKTGFGTDAKAAGASVLAALGVENAEKYATSAQTFLAATQQAVLQRQLEQKGPQTEADAQRITQTAAQRSNTVDANKFLIHVAKEQLRRDVEQRNFYDKWYKTNETYDGAEDAWFNGEGAKSLFDRPSLKKYVSSTQGTPAKPAVVGTYTDAAKEARYQQWLKTQGK